jgi:protein SCO1/2
MEKPTRSIRWLLWSGLALVILTILVRFLENRLRDGSGSEGLPTIGTVPDFSLTNQFGRRVTLEDLRGHVWVADIIFTRCPGPCEKMTREMSRLQSALPEGDSVKLVSLTADPEFDTPEVLKEYGEKFGARPDRWHFLTGGKTDIYGLATRGLLLAVDETKPDLRESDNDLFVHSTKFILVGRHGRIRGVYEGTEAESRPRILEAIRTLLAGK